MTSALCSSDAAAAFTGRRVLLTGASGFLGRHIARQAVAAGVEMHELGRRVGAIGTQFHRADLTDADQVLAIVARVRPHAVIHCAAPGVAYGALDFATMLRIAVGVTQPLYAACAAQAQSPVVVHIGSGFEYAASAIAVDENAAIVPSASLYGAAKVAASAVVGGFAPHLPIMLLRPFHVYGAGEGAQRLGPLLIARVRAGERVALTAGAQQRDFLHIDDCARCIWMALATAGKTPGLTVLNCGSGTAITLRHFIDALADELRRAGLAPDLALGALAYRAHDPMVSLPDITRLNAMLDWRPRVSLAQGIADLVRSELTRCR